MAAKLSTGLRNKILDTGSLKARLGGGFVDVYSGSVPATADAALVGGNTKLCRVSNNSTGTGVTFGTAASGAIAKAGGEVWSGVALNDGTATFYRIVVAGDDGTLSTTQERLQGTVGIGTEDIVLSSVTVVTDGVIYVTSYTVTLPTA